MTVRNQQTKQRNADCDNRNQQQSPPLPMLKHFYRLSIRSISAQNFWSRRAGVFTPTESAYTNRHPAERSR
jgi:hypothetical protein